MDISAEELSSSLGRECRFFLGTERPGIQILTQVLEDLDSFLQGADAMSVENLLSDSVKSWLEQTKDDADVKGLVEVDGLLKLSKVLQERRIVSFLARAGRRFSKLNAIRNQASAGLNSEEFSSPHNNNPEVATSRSGTLLCSFIDDYVDRATNDVIEWLINEEPERYVLSLVGHGGINESTVARKAYNSDIVRDHFDCFCWVDVSESHDIPVNLRTIIKKIAHQTQHDVGELQWMTTVGLFRILRQALQNKRYMVVFEGVKYEYFWHVIKHALPNTHKGSRIIVATASDKVAYSNRESSFDRVHLLEPLSHTASWDLFSRVAFQDEHEMRCPKELEPLSRDIIRMCQGFPIPILGVAGLLSKKEKLVLEWQKLYNNFNLELTRNPEPPGVSEVLALTFHDLPDHLVPCFLYFSIFPEDYLVPKDKLFKLWIAEGFVEDKIGKTLEEVAKDYLNELILRGLVQPYQGLYEFDQFCQVDTLVHNLARVKTVEMNFCQIWCKENSFCRRKSRRVSICRTINTLEDIDSRVQSIFLFNPGYLNISMVSIIITNCILLTMLDFEHHPIQTLPEELGNLFHLKYLNLKNTKVKRLPKSVQKLQNLQTLDVRNTLLIELPIHINKLKNLRHISATDFTNRKDGDSGRGVRINKGIEKLEKLQALTTVDAHLSGVGSVKELANLKELRALGVSGLTAETATALCTCIDEFGSLESLTLQARNCIKTLNLQSISMPLPHLRHLVLKGMLRRLPKWIFHLQNLRSLCLSLSWLVEDPLANLAHLPNLESLRLYRAFEGEQLLFSEGSFEKLKLLEIRDLHGLNVLEIEDGALPSLEELRIGSIPLLNEVPSGIQYLKRLKVLASYDMPDEYMVSMQPDIGTDYWKVKHIPSVIFLYSVQGRNYKFFNLGDSDFLDHLLGLPSDRYDVSKHPGEFELSVYESEDEEDDDEDEDNVGELSFSTNVSISPWRNAPQWSVSSGFYTDDFED